jgi:hypothetical protein
MERRKFVLGLVTGVGTLLGGDAARGKVKGDERRRTSCGT